MISKKLAAIVKGREMVERDIGEMLAADRERQNVAPSREEMDAGAAENATAMLALQQWLEDLRQAQIEQIEKGPMPWIGPKP